MGSRSIVYAPITRGGFEYILSQYPNVPREQAEALYSILTDRLTTETLLFTALIDLIDRYRKNGSASFKLSAIRKDKKGKVQTYAMELLHDVIVELQMAGRAMKKIQTELGKNGTMLAFMHSCESAIVDTQQVDSWLESKSEEEALRTRLDWEGTFEKGVPEAYALEYAEYSEADAADADRCYRIALHAVELTGLTAHELTPQR